MSEMLSLDEAKKELSKLKNALAEFANKVGYDCDSIVFEESANADDRFLRDEMCQITDRVFKLHGDIFDLEKSVSSKGRLWRKANGRYELDGMELTSGCSIEVLMTNSKAEPTWVKTRIEHNGDDYYCVVMGENIALDHLEARCR